MMPNMPQDGRRGGEPAWFSPKTHGYGAGLPCSWQGWALLGGFMALVMGLIPVIGHDMLAYLGVVLPLTVAFVIVVRRTTRGGWRWRWGEEE